MAKNFFKRYIWLVDLLSRRGYISLQEISDEWRSRRPTISVQCPSTTARRKSSLLTDGLRSLITSPQHMTSCRSCFLMELM